MDQPESSGTRRARPEPGARPELIRAAGISKRYGQVHALHGVDLSLQAGEVLALVGDNGAGKSTLMKVICGAVVPETGALLVNGRPASFANPADARRAGIEAVYQDLALVESLDVATNMFLGQLPHRGPFVDRRRMEREAARVLQRMDVAIRSPRTPIGLLPAGHRQAIAIARAVRGNAPIVAMDEPTAALGVHERANVTRIIARLRAQGKGVVLVSHDLQLVFEIADRIQVLRLGRTVGTRSILETSRDEVVAMITGAQTG